MTRSRTVTTSKSATSYSSDMADLADMPSKQTWDILTNLLYRAVLPLAKTTTFALDLIFTILTSTADQRRRISIFESEKCMEVSYGLLFESPEVMMKTIIFDMGVERWVIAKFINDYLQGIYVPKPIETDNSYYYSKEAMIRHVRDMYEVYNMFRRRVQLRFEALSNSQAAKNKWGKDQMGLSSEQGDNNNNYFLSVMRAIDKLYPSKGTLATYVMQWLGNSSGSTFAMYNGEAFNLARPVRKQIHEGLINVNNKAYDLDKAASIPAPEANAINSEDNTMLIDIMASVQRIPKISFTMLLHGFKPVPTPELINDLRRHMVDMEGIENADDFLHLQMPDMEDLPTILPLSRASRKNTESQRRRKESLKLRKGSK